MACLILSMSPFEIITASFYLFEEVLPLIVLSSSKEMTAEAAGTLEAVFFPPKRVSSTYESPFFDLWLALEPNCD